MISVLSYPAAIREPGRLFLASDSFNDHRNVPGIHQ
jgi:hypothetical protein